MDFQVDHPQAGMVNITIGSKERKYLELAIDTIEKSLIAARYEIQMDELRLKFLKEKLEEEKKKD